MVAWTARFGRDQQVTELLRLSTTRANPSWLPSSDARLVPYCNWRPTHGAIGQPNEVNPSRATDGRYVMAAKNPNTWRWPRFRRIMRCEGAECVIRDSSTDRTLPRNAGRNADAVLNAEMPQRRILPTSPPAWAAQTVPAQGTKQLGGAGCLGAKLRKASEVHVVYGTRREGHTCVATCGRRVQIVEAHGTHPFSLSNAPGPRLFQRRRPHSRSLGLQIPMSPRQTHINPGRRTCILRARITLTHASQRHTSSCNRGERGTTKGLPSATSSRLPIPGFMCHFSMVRSGRSQIGRSPCGVQRHVLPHTGKKLVEHWLSRPLSRLLPSQRLSSQRLAIATRACTNSPLQRQPFSRPALWCTSAGLCDTLLAQTGISVRRAKMCASCYTVALS